MGGVGSRVVVEILTIIMLTPTGWIGLGYGFGVEQLKEEEKEDIANTIEDHTGLILITRTFENFP